MISKRLLSKLQIGKKYLITDGIRYLVLEPEEEVIWCKELGFPNNGFFGIYMDDWDSLMRKNEGNSDYWHELKYKYDKTNPTYIFHAHLTHFFASGAVYFSLYDLSFIGEYNKHTDMSKIRSYCSLFGITYKYYKKSERRKKIYGAKAKSL